MQIVDFCRRKSVTEGASASKQPPTPPPSRRGAAAKSAAGEPQSTGFIIEMGDESDPTAAGSTNKPQVKAMPRIAKAKVPPGHAEGEPRLKKQKDPKQEKIFWEDWARTRKINTKSRPRSRASGSRSRTWGTSRRST